MGKSATSAAQTTIAPTGSRTQMMISGATATMGVTCSKMANGKKAVSMTRLCTKRNEINTPSTVAIEKAKTVILMVTHKANPSCCQFKNSVSSVRPGEGTT